MRISDSVFWDAIESARNELSGGYYYDPEYGTEYNFPEKDREVFRKAYDYCYITLHTYIQLDDTIKELELINSQIQHSQDYALQNVEFSTDFILNFSYKNWVIRTNMISELLFRLVNHIYDLRLKKDALAAKLFEQSKVINDKELYFSLLKLVDFMQENILLKVNTKKLKTARNEIVHNANFTHHTIAELSLKLFKFKWGLAATKDAEDIYLDEGMASEKIKKEIVIFSNQFAEKCLPLYTLLSKEFSKTFKILMK